MQYNIIGSDGQQVATAIVPGHDPLIAVSSHPNFPAIVERLTLIGAGEATNEDIDTLVELFRPAEQVARKLQLSRRVRVEGGELLFDGDPIDDGCAKLILRLVGEDGDYQPWVNFMEKIAAHPDPSSREQVFSFLQHNEYGITEDGDLVGYKSVKRNPDGSFRSIRSGTPGVVTVNGEPADAYVTQNVGDVVEMPRSKVTNDPSKACAPGLHVAAYSYASTWASYDALLRIAIDPADIVSVPSDYDAQKMRACRYTVHGVVDTVDPEPVIYVDDLDSEDEYDGGDFANY